MTNDLTLAPPHAEIPPTVLELYWPFLVPAAFAALVFAAAAVLVAWLMLRPRPPEDEPAAAHARRELARLRGQPASTETIAAVSKVFRHYLLARLGLRGQQLTTQELGRKLQSSPRFGSHLAIPCGEFLQQLDEAKFSPATPSHSNAAEQALNLVERCEQRETELQEAARRAPPVYP